MLSTLYTMYGADGQEYGPVDARILAQWARESRVIERTEILDHASGRRFLACDLPELAAVFMAPPVMQTAPAIYLPAASVVPMARSYRSKLVAGLLGIFLGGLGVHRFYLGYTGMGVFLLLMSTLFAVLTCGTTLGIAALWGFIEGIVCLAGGMPDAEGLPLSE